MEFADEASLHLHCILNSQTNRFQTSVHLTHHFTCSAINLCEENECQRMLYMSFDIT